MSTYVNGVTMLRALLLPTVALSATAALAVGAPAFAKVEGPPRTAFEMPFPCGQAWTGTTRSSHSPSTRAIDWNRADDVDDPVVASAAGTVVSAQRTRTGYGHWVMVDHGGESTLYAHLDDILVAVGQSVDQGQQLGTLGSTGNSTGPHLHYEQREGRSVREPWFHGAAFAFGTTQVSQNCVDVPLAGNFVGDPLAELVVFRRAEASTFQIMRAGRGPRVVSFGTATDQPVVGDWDGDGRANAGVRTPETSTFALRVGQEVLRVRLGVPKDQPVAGDWDGDGRWEVGVRRASAATFRLRGADGTVTTVPLGDSDDLPVTGDWDADGRTDVAVYDVATATFTLRRVDADAMVWTSQVQFGEPGDLPVTGDWDGNLTTDLGVWDPATATFTLRQASAPTSARATTRTTVFGNPR